MLSSTALLRRNRFTGGTYFFTLTLKDRSSALLVERVDQLIEAFRKIKRTRPFHIEAMVVLPEHLHAIWTLPSNDDDYSGRWRAIKAGFTRSLLATGIDLKRDSSGEYNLWQRRFRQHALRDDQDLWRHVEYIHFNPVEHGWVGSVKNWPFSTFHRYVRAGRYPIEWVGDNRGIDSMGLCE